VTSRRGAPIAQADEAFPRTGENPRRGCGYCRFFQHPVDEREAVAAKARSSADLRQFRPGRDDDGVVTPRFVEVNERGARRSRRPRQARFDSIGFPPLQGTFSTCVAANPGDEGSARTRRSEGLIRPLPRCAR